MKINKFYQLGHEELLSLNSQLTPNELLLYLYLVTKHPFQDSKVKIDTALISEQLGYHRRTVQLAIKKLVSLRLLPDWFEVKTYENPEYQVVQRLQAKLGGQTEIVTAVGRIDLLTETEIIEVKQVSDWKAALVESRRDIIPCPSLLDPGVRLSPHPAPDVLSFRFCSCVCNRGSFHEWLEGF